MKTLKCFPLSGGRRVGSDYIGPDGKELEPSGLAVLNNKLYMASDNGYLMSVDLADSRPLNAQPWKKEHNFTNDPGYKDNPASYDLECITVATGKLMIGAEGGKKNHSCSDPLIIRYDTVNNDQASSIWEMSDVAGDSLSAGGLEAVTFVPLSAKSSPGCPDFGGTAYYGGYFFAAYQSKPGYVYVYDLPKGESTTHRVNTHLRKFPINLEINGQLKLFPMKVSDMCFADGCLFVLFDGGRPESAKDELHLFKITPKGLIHVAASPLPVIFDHWEEQTDFEGVTIDGSNLYLAVDGPTKLVWCYPNYNIRNFGR